MINYEIRKLSIYFISSPPPPSPCSRNGVRRRERCVAFYTKAVT